MKTKVVILGLLVATIWSCNTENKSPYIFLLPHQEAGFTSVEDLKDITPGSHQEKLWDDFTALIEEDIKHPFLTPVTNYAGRDPVHLKHKNVSYDMALGVCERLARLALMYKATEEDLYKNLVMSQIEALYDTTHWPMWCDHAHVNQAPHVDIRTFRISMWVALCYNWMRNDLSEKEKQFIIDGLDKRAIQPFWEKLAQRPGWYVHRHNWFTNMFGGMGITAMALGNDHPDSERLLDTIVPEMIDFNSSFGEMGEFNEPPGYAGAVRFSVEFAEAYRYYTSNKRNLLAEKPFPDVCYWIMYHTLPPGRMMPFGDTNRDQRLSSPSVIAAAANANNDGILQWYYLENFEKMTSPMELFWFNPKVEAINPQGKLPLGIAYKEHGADIISRTSWDQQSTPCIVYGKAGRETNHDDNDVGQLCIDGYGKALIIDPGKPKPIYPKDYFRKTQYEYYTRSVRGHNILQINNNEIKSEPNNEARGETVRVIFNDSLGSFWEIDVTPVYTDAQTVTRKVAHLYPGIIAVHDYAVLKQPGDINLRWHFAAQPKLNMQGFQAINGEAKVTGRIISLNKSQLQYSTGFHEFKPPYHLTRQGDPLEQYYEPFIKISAEGDTFSSLTLFAVSKSTDEVSAWEKTSEGWQININNEVYTLLREANDIVLQNSSGKTLQMDNFF
jgi:hypothetical protein